MNLQITDAAWKNEYTELETDSLYYMIDRNRVRLAIHKFYIQKILSESKMKCMIMMREKERIEQQVSIKTHSIVDSENIRIHFDSQTEQTQK